MYYIWLFAFLISALGEGHYVAFSFKNKGNSNTIAQKYCLTFSFKNKGN
jgi:hypothetical protein